MLGKLPHQGAGPGLMAAEHVGGAAGNTHPPHSPWDISAMGKCFYTTLEVYFVSVPKNVRL